jgi:hypothetical protein
LKFAEFVEKARSGAPGEVGKAALNAALTGAMLLCTAIILVSAARRWLGARAAGAAAAASQ